MVTLRIRAWAHGPAGKRCIPVLLLALSAGAQCRVKPSSAKPRKPPVEPITVPMRLLLAHAESRATPVYPEAARAAKIDGTVIIAIEVNHEGVVTQMLPLSGPVELRSAAKDALQAWHFESFCIKGVPYTVRSAVAFQFRWRGDGSRVQQP